MAPKPKRTRSIMPPAPLPTPKTYTGYVFTHPIGPQGTNSFLANVSFTPPAGATGTPLFMFQACGAGSANFDSFAIRYVSSSGSPVNAVSFLIVKVMPPSGGMPPPPGWTVNLQININLLYPN